MDRQKTKGRETGSGICQLCHGGHSLKVCWNFAWIGSKVHLEREPHNSEYA